MAGDNIPMIEPARVTAGDSLVFRRYLPDFAPDEGWTLSYALVRTGVRITFTATDTGDGGFEVEVSPATTAAWSPGAYAWQAYVTKEGERRTVGTGRISIEPDFASQAQGFDGRTFAERALEALEATIEGRASSDQMSMQIRGRAISRMSLAEMTTARDYFRRLVREEERARKISRRLDSGRRIFLRFR